MLLHVIDMRGPWIDEGHILASLHHMGAGIPANRTRSNDGYLPAHAFLLAFSCGRKLARQPVSSQWSNPCSFAEGLQSDTLYDKLDILYSGVF
jgi:hypothetical protein